MLRVAAPSPQVARARAVAFLRLSYAVGGTLYERKGKSFLARRSPSCVRSVGEREGAFLPQQSSLVAEMVCLMQ